VQAVFIDNSLSGQTFSLTSLIAQQTVTLKTGEQAYLPLIAPPSTKYQATIGAVPGAGLLVKVQFLNFAVPGVVWS
jgi:hypothetical protein